MKKLLLIAILAILASCASSSCPGLDLNGKSPDYRKPGYFARKAMWNSLNRYPVMTKKK